VTVTNVTGLKQLFVDGSEKTSAGADGTGSLTGTVRSIRGPYINGYTFEPPYYIAPTPTYSGGSIEKPTLDMVVGDQGMVDHGLFSLDSDLATWSFSDFGRAWLGFDPTVAVRNVFQLSGIDFRAWGAFVDDVLHPPPTGHGTMTNTAAVGDEVVLYDENGAVVLLPGHRIDPFFSGYGIDPPFTITSDGRVVLSWSLAGYNKFFTYVTRDAAGEYGPVITIDVTT
jgi:hypothetical protein